MDILWHMELSLNGIIFAYILGSIMGLARVSPQTYSEIYYMPSLLCRIILGIFL